MKLGVVVPRYPFGGAERQAMGLVECCASKGGCDCLLVSLDGGASHNNVLDLGVDILVASAEGRVLRLLKRGVATLRVFCRLRRLKFTHLVFYNHLFLPLLLLLKFFTRTKVVFSVRENSSLCRRFWFVKIARICDGLYTNTPVVQDYYLARGVDCELFLNSIDMCSAEISYKCERRGVLVVSNIKPHKRVDFIIDALSESTVTINIAGAFADEDYFDLCKKKAALSRSNVNFLGRVDRVELSRLYNESCVFIHASVLEGTSNAILDAVKHRCPMLVSDVPENSFLVLGRPNFCFKADDKVDFLAKYYALLNSDNEDGLRDIYVQNVGRFSYDNMLRCLKYIMSL